MITILDGVASGTIAKEGAVELIMATGVTKESAQRMVSTQATAKPEAQAEAELEANIGPTTPEEKSKIDLATVADVGFLLKQGIISRHVAVKAFQAAGMTRKRAERVSKSEATKANVLRSDDDIYDTCDEAKRIAEGIGCQGCHEHDVGGTTKWMPCSSMEEYEKVATVLESVEKGGGVSGLIPKLLGARMSAAARTALGNNILEKADDCGTGAGGFKPGNDCAEGHGRPEGSKDIPKQGWEVSSEEFAQGLDPEDARGFPVAEETVSGLKVRDEVPNMESIQATYEDPVILDGVREVFIPNAKESAEKDGLAQAIQESGEINPLIVGVDSTGVSIIEGSHRIDSLRQLGVESFPAVVAVDGSAHEEIVRQAVKDGKEVPSAVLDEYGISKTNQTDTPEFKDWFGESKVANWDGTPKVQYHGTQAGEDFSAFRAPKDSDPVSSALFVAPRTWIAEQYAGGEEGTDKFPKNARLIPVYASIQKPYMVGGIDQGITIGELRAEGYDGIVDAAGGYWAAFDPSQLKSSIGNDGSFDADNPDLTKSAKDCGTGAGGFKPGNDCAEGHGRPEGSKGPAKDRAGKEIKDSRGRTVPLNTDGTMTVYLATDEETARQIAETGKLPDGEIVVTSSEYRADKKGEAVVSIRVQPEDLQIEEEVEQLFADDALFDFSVEQDAVQAGQLVPVGAAENSKDTLAQPGTLNVKQPDELQHNPQVDTQEFAEWFGNGVQHSDGEPVQLYHGTKRDFDQLQGSERYEDSAFFLTSNPKFAGEWPSGTGGLRKPGEDAAQAIAKIEARENELNEIAIEKVKSEFGLEGNEKPTRGPEQDRYYEAIGKIREEVNIQIKEESGFTPYEARNNLGIRVVPVYAAAQKTFYPPRDYKLVEHLLREEAKQDPSILKMMKEGHHKYGNWFLYERSGLAKGLRKMGYDGIWITEGLGRGNRDHTTLAIWDSSLAKSSIGNSGEWNVNDPRLTKAADNCGTGAGGFQPGNDCAEGHGEQSADGVNQEKKDEDLSIDDRLDAHLRNSGSIANFAERLANGELNADDFHDLNGYLSEQMDAAYDAGDNDEGGDWEQHQNDLTDEMFTRGLLDDNFEPVNIPSKSEPWPEKRRDVPDFTKIPEATEARSRHLANTFLMRNIGDEDNMVDFRTFVEDHNLELELQGRKATVHIDSKDLREVLFDGGFLPFGHPDVPRSTNANTSHREHIERRMGLEGSEWHERPVYAAFSSNDWEDFEGGHGSAGSFGNVEVVLKDSVLSRSTVTFGDSGERMEDPNYPKFDPPESTNAYPVPIAYDRIMSGKYSEDEAHAAHSTNYIYSQMTQGNDTDSWTEAQIWGGVTVDDIESVRVSPAAIEEDRKTGGRLSQMLTEAGIEIEVAEGDWKGEY